MKKLIDMIDNLSEKIGTIVSWVSVFLVLVISLDVVIRYVFKFTYIWINELETHLFALMFLLASGYALKRENHVRIDVLYAGFSEKTKAWINLIGGVLLLFPWCYIIILYSWEYAYNSFLIREGSSQPGGIPALYVLKFSIPLGFMFLLLQGLSSVLNSFQVIIKK